MVKYRNAESGLPGIGFVAVRKSADETVTSTTTLQDDDELLFAIGASENWIAQVSLYVVTGSTADFRLAFTVPASATILVNGMAHGTSTDVSGSVVLAAIGDVYRIRAATPGGTISLTGSSANIAWVISLEVVVANSTTAGNVTLQFAQGTSDGANTTVKASSSLIAYRVT